MVRTAVLRWSNLSFAGFACCGGIGILLFSSEWALSGFEQAIYFSFFISFAFAFFLFSRTYPIKEKIRTVYRTRWFMIANGVILVLFCLYIGFIYQQLNSEPRLMLDAKGTHARIYRVDPEGYRKQRKIYYTFEVEGERYMGVENQSDPTHRIGDSVRIVFSQGQPSNNRVLK